MKKIWLMLLIGMLSLSVVTGCSGSDSNVEESIAPEESSEKVAEEVTEDTELTEIVVAELRSEFWIQAYLADSLGFFEEEGLAVEFVTTTDGPVAFQAMHAGSSHFTMLSTEPVLRAQDQGLESTILLSTLKNKPYMLIGAEGIERVEDLKGETIFAGMPGSAPYSFAVSILEKHGMSEEDVEWAQMEYGASLGALENGHVAAIYLRSTAKDEAAAINANVIVDVSDSQQHEEIYGTARYESSIIVGTKEFVEDNPEEVQAFVNAIVKAMAWLEDASNEEVVDIASEHFQGRGISADQIEYLRPSLNPDGMITEAGHETIIAFCMEEGIIERDISFEEIYDLTFLTEAIEMILE
ncbi:ABC transporter substrate-binding protein [Tindallia californiensis]|uniref:NitT/TauT family transport system substrate-binding protein n=1 Tax=Tindallia californiensis TaxID=159292 RepID=A0A1H3Q3C6_9FIRM|nr:ABC transporter substrate-binding protein [Tindallia californiensis]SDZ07608.1 NitT/TauT family transport system substrate-binding protein [Tindallia californiensis]